MINEYLTKEMGYIIAGIIGGVLSLSFIKRASQFEIGMSILSGAACAYYFTNPIVQYFYLINFEDPIAFFLGLFGMNIIGGVFVISQKFRTKPLETLKNIRKGVDSDGK